MDWLAWISSGNYATIGVRHWLNRNKIEEENTAAPNISKSGVFSAFVGVAAVTFANGAITSAFTRRFLPAAI
ncbi:MAG TPA: hypothetical protein VNI84_18695 [Pyrinomonadaceae bacterium]|nr:hypothetical protein [Pyrinomonadaceae bacterium]